MRQRCQKAQQLPRIKRLHVAPPPKNQKWEKLNHSNNNNYPYSEATHCLKIKTKGFHALSNYFIDHFGPHFLQIRNSEFLLIWF